MLYTARRSEQSTTVCLSTNEPRPEAYRNLVLFRDTQQHARPAECVAPTPSLRTESVFKAAILGRYVA